ncbi:RISC-loading complex subunit tarbp2-like [Linepithema humile]|uniref:RISC-loading complex subunit tarbp2-like n=1 Tax=Linepithema humile TaxID=83485 RepID=UPI00062305A6|nr:PREDICTED: RISC-loading complex subunit tarbp2-like [Linepithema humile]XP_012219200.1 PREDICTED: RISC-loading complex subunit tarbp2-like [Linepithema humile]
MAKSPISFLQEFAIKQGYVPMYDFKIMNPNGNSKQFFCKVICKDLSTDGTGNSKKEAKQKAAENMLLLLGQSSKVSMSSTISSLSSDVDKTPVTQNSTMICNTPSSSIHLQLISEMIDIKSDVNKNIKESSLDSSVNYIGVLQELCVRQKLSPRDISYKVIGESGPSHMRCFIIEVSVKSLRAHGTAQSKKIAKQEAAKNLLHDLGLDKLAEVNNVSNEILEESMRKLGIGISESKPALPIVELSDKAQSIYLECTNKVNKSNKLPEHFITNLHILFENTYVTKIPHNMIEKMQIIRIDQTHLIQEMRLHIERMLKLRIEQSIICKSEKGYVVSLRLLSIHNITQIGIGKTKDEAETMAMYNIITAILILVN